MTRLESQMVSADKLRQADIFPHLVDGDIGPVILSGRPTASGQLSVISFFRRVGQPIFSSRESRMAHIILSEVPWLHDQSWPQHPRAGISSLTPRQRTILGLLLQGVSRKEVAAQVELSIHTVNDYVKEIYEAFDVHSQPELIRRFVEGDGGDHAPLRE